MRTLFAFLLAFGIFFAMGAFVEVAAPWLSMAQIMLFAALSSAFVFLGTILAPDFLAPPAPIPSRSRGGGAVLHQTNRRPRAIRPRSTGTMVSILWGVIRVEITPMQAVPIAA